MPIDRSIRFCDIEDTVLGNAVSRKMRLKRQFWFLFIEKIVDVSKTRTNRVHLRNMEHENDDGDDTECLFCGAMYKKDDNGKIKTPGVCCFRWGSIHHVEDIKRLKNERYVFIYTSQLNKTSFLITEHRVFKSFLHIL